jgi:hypothetical protein
MLGALSPATYREELPDSVDLNPEQPRDFHFPVTWVTLFAELDPTEAAGLWTPAVVEPFETPSTALALVPVVDVPAIPQPQQAPGTAWEMVVPKMIRTGPGSFAPAETSGPQLL